MGCCGLFSGIARDCDANVGGIKRAWIACYDAVTDKIVTNDQISVIKFDEGAFCEFQFRKQTGSVSQSYQLGDNGTSYYEQTITFVFAKQETEKQIEINALAISDLVVIIEDNNGKFWYFGFDNPVTLSANEAESGTAFGDFNGYTVTLLGTDWQLAYEVTDTAMKSIIA
ncbi:MAG: hypothetical protein LUH10_00485 [Tannerellaceae bacterium]|nr:hypothetical protein [Tannerellaceae bacterium]